MVARLFSLLTLLILLAGCGLPWGENQIGASAEGQLLRKAFDQLTAGELQSLKANFEPKLANAPGIDETLRKMRAEIPAEAPKEIVFVLWNVSQSVRNGRTSVAWARCEYGEAWILMQLAFVGEPDKLRISGFYLQHMAGSYEEMTAFRLVGQSPGHYVFAILMAASVLLCAGAFITCLLTPRFPRKWLWGLFTILGLGGIGMNWMTGEISVAPLQFLLFGASAMQDPYGSWNLSFGLPVGAILFLLRRRALRRRSSASDTAAPEDTASSH